MSDCVSKEEESNHKKDITPLTYSTEHDEKISLKQHSEKARVHISVEKYKAYGKAHRNILDNTSANEYPATCPKDEGAL